MRGAYAKRPKPRAKVLADCKHCGPGVPFYDCADGCARCVACQLARSTRWIRANRDRRNANVRASRARRLRENPDYEREVRRNNVWRQRNRVTGRKCLWCPRTDKETSFPVRAECQACNRRGQRNGRDDEGRPLYRGTKHKRVTS